MMKMKVSKHRQGCRLPERSAREIMADVKYSIGDVQYSIPAELIFIKSGVIKKKASKLLKANPTIEEIQKLYSQGVIVEKLG